MKEARVECLATRYELPELALSLRKGQVLHLPESTAQGSVQLLHATRVGAVAVRYVERSKVAKPPSPPHVRMSRPNSGRRVRVPAPEVPQAVFVAPSPAPIPAADVRDLIREEVAKALSGRGLTKTDLKDALAEVLGGLPLGGVSRPAASARGPADPVYIPSDIVDKDMKSDIKVTSESSEGSELDAASAALKALPKAGKKPPKKQE